MTYGKLPRKTFELVVQKILPSGKPQWTNPSSDHGVTGFAKSVPVPKAKPPKT